MRALAFFASAFVALQVHAADVYRTVDENGEVTFSDRPEESSSERIVVVTARPVARTAAPAPQRANAMPEQVTVDGGEIILEPTAEERAAERARNCQAATERAERYRNSRRLYRELPDGEREYLDDAQIDAAKAQADADVTRWCG